MRLLPNKDLQETKSFNFAPMMDFLFLMMAIFAVLAISRSDIFDENIRLFQHKKAHTSSQDTGSIRIAITSSGKYKWISELNQYLLEDEKKLQQEIIRRYELGLISKEKEKTKVLLHIDKDAPWGEIAKAIFAIKEIGFSPHPVYQMP